MPSSPSTRARLLLPLVLAATLCPAAGATAVSGAYVALGDSYASGVGAGTSGVCMRSRRSYVHRLGRRVTSFRACAGATTASVLSGQLAPLPGDTRLVTISVGGNDAGFVDVIQTCLFAAPGKCDTRVRRAERFVREDLAGRLGRVYDAIRERAPDARVLVVGYPRLFARRPWCSDVGEIGDREQRRLNEASNLPRARPARRWAATAAFASSTCVRPSTATASARRRRGSAAWRAP